VDQREGPQLLLDALGGLGPQNRSGSPLMGLRTHRAWSATPSAGRSDAASSEAGACLFASETSCERGNRYLDRAAVVDTLATAGVGYFPS
ncbi:MAG: hypothetical protein ACRD0K_09100, partial [Egibacteraceae bacterium]